MNVFNATQIALHALGRNKLRSALTALGIIIGVGSLIALLGIGHGARAQVEAQVASLGENVIQVSPGSLSKNAVKLGLGSSAALTLEDAEAIRQEVPDAVAVSPEVKIKTQVVSGNRNWSTEIYGDSPDYFTIREWDTVEGETFTDQDVRGATKVAVIGQEAAEELFGEGEDAIGEIIRIRNVPFKVVGILVAKGASASGSDQDDGIIVPYTTALKQLIGKQTGLRRIYVQAANLQVLPVVEKKVADLLRQRHHIEAGSDDDFKVEVDKRKEEQTKIEGEKKEIGFGSQIRSYVLQPYQMVKDVRTEHEVGDVQRILDGDLSEFVDAYLAQGARKSAEE